jgi:hypothetical protein
MSSKINNSKQIYSAKKPCCKVCVDAGKTEKEYSSHYVKDLNGNVTCPTLLNQECRVCHKKGHTTSFCPTLKKQENIRKPPVSPPKKEVPAQKKANVFAYLDFNSDEESDNEDEVEQFPELVVAATKDPFEKEKKAEKKFSYASMAAKTQVEYKIEQFKETKITPFVDKKFEVKIHRTFPEIQPGQSKSWVELCNESDSEGDEEEFDEDNSAW